MRFDNMDFGKGAASFRIAIRGKSSRLKDGALQVRIDNPAGRLIGEARVGTAEDPTAEHVLNGAVAIVDGIHTVFLIAHGSHGDSVGHLYGVDWFTFDPLSY